MQAELDQLEVLIFKELRWNTMKPQTGVMQFEDAASWSEHLRQAAELASVSFQSTPCEGRNGQAKDNTELAAAAGKAQG